MYIINFWLMLKIKKCIKINPLSGSIIISRARSWSGFRSGLPICVLSPCPEVFRKFLFFSVLKTEIQKPGTPEFQPRKLREIKICRLTNPKFLSQNKIYRKLSVFYLL